MKKLLKRLLTRAVHFLFVRRFKITLRSKWYEVLSDLGEVEKIAIKREGGSLSCLKVTTEKSSDKIAILAHPIARKGKFYYNEGIRIKIFLELGYQVFIFDFNGFGESSPIDFFYWKDTQAILQQVCQTSKEVVFYGISFGGYQSIHTFSLLPQNSSVILENVNYSLFEIVTAWSTNRLFVAFYNFVQRLNLAEVNDMNIIQSLQNLKRQDLKFLLIAGEKDTIAPESNMKETLSHISGHKKMVTIKNAEHMNAHIADQKEYTAVIKEFLCH